MTPTPDPRGDEASEASDPTVDDELHAGLDDDLDDDVDSDDAGGEIEEDLFDPPWSITLAVRLMWAGAVLTLLVPAIGFFSVDSIKANIAAQLREQHQYSPGEVDSVYQNLVISNLIFALAGALLWIWMSRTNGAGKRWARTIATGLGMVNILAFGLSLNQGDASVVQLVLSGSSIALAGTILVLLWLPDSSDFYYMRSLRR